ncbi:MAG: hypothetical protein WA765_15985, partial [Candidatus Acidiferrum sp.]
DANGIIVGTEVGNGASTLLNDKDTISVNFGESLGGNFLAATVGHEGEHVVQADNWLEGGESSVGDINHYLREEGGWTVGAAIAQALGMNNYAPYGGGSDQQAWNKGWKAAEVATKRASGIKNILNYMKMRYGDDAMLQTYTAEHHHQD